MTNRNSNHQKLLRTCAAQLRGIFVGTALLGLALCATPIASAAPTKTPTPPENKQPAKDAEQQKAESAAASFAKRLLDRLRGKETPDPHERNHEAVKAAFREIVAPVSHSTAIVLVNDDPVALGTVVESSGYLLTKASECHGELACQLRDGRKLPATIVGIHQELDLAMLKVDATDLTPVVWSENRKTLVGSFLATAGIADDPLAIGVVSVAQRRIAPSSGVLGVRLEEVDSADGPRIEEIFPDSGAEKAGLRVKDIVLKINGKRTKTLPEMINLIRGRKAGDRVKLNIRRGEQELEFNATLGNHFSGLPRSRSDYQNNLGGKLSSRKAGFSQAIQHDTALKPNQCGGPLVGLDGKVLGLNIARAGRVISYALPAAVVLPVLDELRSGKLAPPSPAELLAVQLQEAANALAARAAALKQHEVDIEAAEKALEEAAAALAAANQAKADAEKQLGELRAGLIKSQKAVKQAQTAHEQIKKQQPVKPEQAPNEAAQADESDEDNSKKTEMPDQQK